MNNSSSIGQEWAARFATLMGERSERPRSAPLETVELLTPEEMAEADRRTVAAGVRSAILMERAGAAVATAAGRMAAAGARIAVLAGPGNNGGDGFVAARMLDAAGYHVTVFLSGDRDQLKGDASLAARGWHGTGAPAHIYAAHGAVLVLPALWGAGLPGRVAGDAAAAIDGVNESGVPVLAVDLPSGVDGNSGAILGRAVFATETVTFFRRKPGHLLLPGRVLTGPLTVADIGNDPACLAAIRPKSFHNQPSLWLPDLPAPRIDGHKYDRGHAVVVSGPLTGTGAARLAARAALRVGAGLVTVASPPDAVAVNASHLTAIMLMRMYDADGLAEILADRRKNAVVLGPAAGVGEETAALVGAALASEAGIVIDADGLTSFAGEPQTLFALTKGRRAPVVMTPHEGEFSRLFSEFSHLPSKLDRARRAAERAGAVIVLKGPDTVVAAPDGKAAIADNAPADLATAGAGDVLAGLGGGLLAQGRPPCAAAAAAVWMHGRAAVAVGRGLIAEDLPEALPAVLNRLAADARTTEPPA